MKIKNILLVTVVVINTAIHTQAINQTTLDKFNMNFIQENQQRLERVANIYNKCSSPKELQELIIPSSYDEDLILSTISLADVIRTSHQAEITNLATLIQTLIQKENISTEEATKIINNLKLEATVIALFEGYNYLIKTTGISFTTKIFNDSCQEKTWHQDQRIPEDIRTILQEDYKENITAHMLLKEQYPAFIIQFRSDLEPGLTKRKV